MNNNSVRATEPFGNERAYQQAGNCSEALSAGPAAKPSEEIEAMGITGPQPVGPGCNVPVQMVNNQPAANGIAGQTAESTTIINTQASASSSKFISMIGQDSPLRTILEQLTATELQSLILQLLLGNKEDEQDSSPQKLLAMALMGTLMENRDPRSSLMISNTVSQSINVSVTSTQAVVAAYTENQIDPTTAADPGASALPVTKIDTTA